MQKISVNSRFFFVASILFYAFFLGACASAPVAYNEQKDQGTWHSKVQIKDLKTNKSNVLDLEILSEKNQKMRMEITGTLGVRVGSLLMSGENVSYAVHTQKKYYSGSISEKSLLPLFKIELDPRWLYSVFFDEPLQGSNWKCTDDAKGLVEKCEQATTGNLIFWSERKGENKRVLLKGTDFEINVVVKSFETKVQNPDRAFNLEPPATYKRYKLL